MKRGCRQKIPLKRLLVKVPYRAQRKTTGYTRRFLLAINYLYKFLFVDFLW
jgi:hypothetical protein